MKVLIGKTSAAMRGLMSEGSSVAATIRVVFKMTWAHLNRAVFAGPLQLVQAEWAARGVSRRLPPSVALLAKVLQL